LPLPPSRRRYRDPPDAGLWKAKVVGRGRPLYAKLTDAGIDGRGAARPILSPSSTIAALNVISFVSHYD
jgi:hypothetical protein